MRRLKALVLILIATVVPAGGALSCNEAGGGSRGSFGGYSGYDAGITCRNYTTSKTVPRLWEQLSPSGSAPQVRYGASSAYDRARDTFMVFGGTDKASFYNDVRLLANASGANGTPAWSTRQVSGTPPPPRAFAIAAYNSTQDTLFIFGGVDSSNKIQADLWKLDNAIGTGGAPSWSSVPIAGAAPAPVRGNMSGIYSDKSDMLVFFGGINCAPSSCTNYSDTYAIRGLGSLPTWAQVSTTGAPPGRYFHSSVYDAANDTMVIFGGNATTNVNGDAAANLDDVWGLSNATGSGSTWRELTPSSAARPGAKMGHSAVFDADSARMLVYGGVNTKNTVTTDTWGLSGLSSGSPQWFAYDTGSPVPASRTLHAAAYTGSTLNRMIVFGGSEGGGTYANDTWVLHNANGLPTTPITRIAIASASTTVCRSNWVELTATAYDTNGNEVSGLFVWSSSDDSIATVDAEGRVTGIAQGTVTITVSDATGTVKGTISIVVVPATSTSGVGGRSGAGGGSGGGTGGGTNCTCYCGWPANQVCTSNTDCPPDTSVPGTYVPGVCGCPIGC